MLVITGPFFGTISLVVESDSMKPQLPELFDRLVLVSQLEKDGFSLWYVPSPSVNFFHQRSFE